MIEKPTLRDKFAMAALRYVFAPTPQEDNVAEWAYRMADQMMEARKK